MQLKSTQDTNAQPFFVGTPSHGAGGFFKKLGTCLIETPAEALAFAVAAAAMRVFIPCLSAPLLGISAGLLATKLVLKISSCYTSNLLISLTKEACKLNRKYPKLQLIAFIFAMSISFLSRFLGIVLGIALGSFGAVILDIENYKLLQKVTRKQNLILQ